MDKTKKKTVVRELDEMRTHNRKAFEMSDGTKQLVFYPKAVNAFDEETKGYKDVDNTLTVEEDGKHYRNGKNRFTARFSNEDTNDELFSIEDDIYSVSVAAKKNQKVSHKRVMPERRRIEETDTLSDKLVFGDITDGVDYEYSVNGSGVKENIIVKKKADSYRYQFELTCKNVSAVYDDKRKRVIFCEPENNAEVFNIPSPVMTDANGTVSTAVEYEMRPMEDGKIIFTVIADDNWINDDNRAFPVTIDPMIECSKRNAFTTFTYVDGDLVSGMLNTVGIVAEDGEILTNRMYISFDSLDIPQNIKVKKAELTLYQWSFDITETANRPWIGIYDASDEELTSGSTIADNLGYVIDYERAKIASESDDVVSYKFDITHFFEGVMDNNFDLSSIAVKMLDETYTENNYVIFYGGSNSSYYPTLAVTYENNYAINTSASVHTHEIGRFGTGMIDLKYGNLMFESEDFAWNGNKMPVTIKHLYHSNLAGYQYTETPSIELNTAYFDNMNVGLGWRLNIMQSMTAIIFTHEGVEYGGYVFIDENGAETYFVRSNDDTNKYEDVDGNGMIYNKTTHELTNGSETYLFDNAGRLIRITDEHSNYMSINYIDDRITSVTDGAGRDFLFAYYSNGDLKTITAPDGTKITYFYTNGTLEVINYPDNKTAVITTESDKITMVDIYNGGDDPLYRVYYTYTGNKVADVEERGTAIINGIALNEYGAYTRYTYSIASGKTTVRTTEIADADSGETTDNIVKTIYTFDADGNILSSFVDTDDFGNMGTDGDTAGINPHSADGGVDLASNVVNLIIGNTFESLEAWNDISGTDCDYTITSEESETEAYFGRHYLRIATDDYTDTEAGKYQITEELVAGNYTFSAYVRVAERNIIGSSDNSGAYLRVSEEDGTVISESDHIWCEESGYTRLVVPFTLETDQCVKIEIVLRGKGCIYVNAPQLENNSYANSYNMLENGSFENGLVKWNTTGFESLYSTAGMCLGGIASVDGDINEVLEIKQEVAVKQKASTRETFTLSGWAKGYSIVKRERVGAMNPQFRLRAEIVYSEENIEEHMIDFSPYTTEWQYASIQFEKQQYLPIDHINVYCDFWKNEGTIRFDNIALVRNSIKTGLSAEDFSLSSNGDVIYDAVEDSTVSANTADPFEEAYDEYGNPLTETTFTDGEFGTMYRSFEYTPDAEGDLAGNDLVAEYDTLGNKTEYEVDPDTSRVTKVTDRSGNITAYEYDDSGRTTKVTNKNSTNTALAAVDYTYDEFDNLTSIERGDGMDYLLTYNQFHKLESIVVGNEQELVAYKYKDGNGRLKRITYANGDYMEATYNKLGQLITEKWYNSNDTLTAHYKYSYDHDGNVVRSIDIFAEVEYNYVYEEGRIIRATQCSITMSGENVTSKSLELAINYVYDESGKLIRKYTADANTNGNGTYYEYDENDSVIAKFKIGKWVTSHSKSDSFGRKIFDELQLGNGFVSRQFSYHAGVFGEENVENGKLKSSPTTNLVNEIVMSDGHILSYEYDKEERITKVTDTDTTVSPNTSTVTEYTYDALGQLLTEKCNGVTVNTMVYDNYGNITSKNGISYTYDTTWKDLLTSYNGQAITYDAQGNPTTYLGHTLTWEKGRQLKSFDNNTYTYNANGIRTSKTVNGVVHNYLLDGAKILSETWGENELVTLWDNEDNVCGINYNGDSYYFLKNLQGDIIAITNESGNVVARYSYDAWGAPTIVSDDSGVNIATVNPFRYRGYHYDTEIGMYYLQSRYYDPTVGRFVNADELVFLNGYRNIVGLNLLSYCLNSPISYYDPNGKWVLSVGVEGQAAFALGAYAGVSVNIDGNWNISITYAIGFAIITNISASIQVYVAYYINKQNVSQVTGWGISVGASASLGVHVSGGGSFDVGFDGSPGGNLNVGFGVGASVAPIPYFQTRIGYSGTLYTMNLQKVLNSWKNNQKKSLWVLALNVVIVKRNGYIEIYIRSMNITILVYNGGKITIK